MRPHDVCLASMRDAPSGDRNSIRTPTAPGLSPRTSVLAACHTHADDHFLAHGPKNPIQNP
jgi:hypothetical protein